MVSQYWYVATFSGFFCVLSRIDLNTLYFVYMKKASLWRQGNKEERVERERERERER